MSEDKTINLTPLSFVEYDEDKEAHQAFIFDLVGQGRDAWRKWRSSNQSPLFFTGLEFPENTSFNGFIFGPSVDFSFATFGDGVSFQSAQFSDSATFTRAIFGSDVSFHQTKFGNDVSFQEAEFGNNIVFIGAKFGSNVRFHQAKFMSNIFFNNSIFGKYTDFSFSTFHKNVTFDLLTIEGAFDMSHTSFNCVPSISVSSEDEKIKFDVLGMKVRLTAPPLGREGKNLQRLKAISDATGAVNESRDWFILQRRLERDVAWGRWSATFFSRDKTTDFPLPQSTLAGLFWILSDYGRSVVLPIIWLLVSIPLFYFLYRWLYPIELKMAAQRAALIDYTLSSSVPFGRMLNPAFDRAFDTLFPRYHHPIIGTVDITVGFQIASVAQGIISVILIFLIGLSIRNYFKIT